jgi:pilus assembly protein CpaB
MRLRTILLFLIAVLLAGGTTMMARSWLAAQRTQVTAEAAPAPPPVPTKSVLVARIAINRGQILKPDDLAWQPWPNGGPDNSYILQGAKTPDAYAGWVARNPIAPGEPLTESKIVAPGNRGFLAAVLRPGMRAVSVPVTVTTGISGFIFPGDTVDILITYQLPNPGGNQAGADKFEHKASETVLHDIRVIAIDQRTESKPGEAVVAHTATLEVTPKQSEIIALATEIGKLSLSLRSLVPDESAKLPGGEAAIADSANERRPTYTLDHEVSPLLPKTSGGKGNTEPVGVTILRGNGKGGDSPASQPASRGS